MSVKEGIKGRKEMEGEKGGMKGRKGGMMGVKGGIEVR